MKQDASLKNVAPYTQHIKIKDTTFNELYYTHNFGIHFTLNFFGGKIKVIEQNNAID